MLQACASAGHLMSYGRQGKRMSPCLPTSKQLRSLRRGHQPHTGQFEPATRQGILWLSSL